MSPDWSVVSEIGGMPTTRASRGFAQRASWLQGLVGQAHAFLGRGLGTSFAPVVVVLDEADWHIGGDEAPPYGIPYATDDGFELVIPADPSHNFLVDIYAACATRDEAERFADLIAVHELGHQHVRELGLDLPNGWLSELLATYLAACYLTACRSEDAALWFKLSRAHAVAVSPEHRSLEELDELYLGVGPENYIWYQNTLSLMVEQVQVDLGLEFVLGLRSAALTPASDTEATLAAAERAWPGFQSWGESLRG